MCTAEQGRELGAILMVSRECRFPKLGRLTIKKRALTYQVRAFITDNAKVTYDLREAVTEPSSAPIRLLSGPLTIYNHYGRDKAVFFELVPGAKWHPRIHSRPRER